MYTKLIFTLLCINEIKINFAQVLVKQCANVEVVQNFHLQDFMGTWTEISRYPLSLFKGDCAVAQYNIISNDDPTVFEINITVAKTLNELEKGDNIQTLMMEATNHFVDNPSGKNGKFLMKFTNPYDSWRDYSIIDTDYTNYAIIYSCQDNASLIYPKEVHLLVLGRDKSLPAKINNMVMNTLSKYKIDESKLVSVSKNCYGL